MEGLQNSNYVEMSLDDVIRDMKAKKALEQKKAENNSPFFMQPEGFRFNRRPYRAIQPRKSNRSNYVNHMAKKRVQQARRTLDLRHKLIAMRADKQGLDLRWKLVANMIFKLRLQAQKSQSRRGFHPPQQLENFHEPRFSPYGHTHIMSSQPKVNRAALSQVERLVGRLPSWMKATAASMVPGGTQAQPNHLRPNGFVAPPVRTSSQVFSPPASNPGTPMEQHTLAQNNVHHSYQISPPSLSNIYQTFRQPTPGQMPPLVYEPSPVIRPPTATKTSRIGVIKNTGLQEDIHFSVVVDGDGPKKVKTTLNERFTQ